MMSYVLSGQGQYRTFSMEGQKAKTKSKIEEYGLGTTWGRVINYIIFIIGWTIPLTMSSILVNTYVFSSVFADDIRLKWLNNLINFVLLWPRTAERFEMCPLYGHEFIHFTSCVKWPVHLPKIQLLRDLLL